MEAVLQHAVQACPFLHNLQQREGPAFARAFALNPTAPAAATAARQPILEEGYALGSLLKAFTAFHHPTTGAVPLARPSAVMEGLKDVMEQPAAPAASIVACSPAEGPSSGTRKGLSGTGLPLATMSMSFGNMPDFGKFLRSLQQQHKQHQPKARKHNPSTSSSSGPKASGSAAAASSSTASTGSSNASAGGTCPMRKLLGPLAPIVFNPQGHLQCPEAIVKARAALAATKPVRELRPQALPVKLLAVGATAATLNVPCGMWREHCEKFSGSWFVAVHASIPFIAMLRKAVIMPKYAVLFSIASAVAGQAMGARLERARLRANAPTRIATSAPAPIRITSSAAVCGPDTPAAAAPTSAAKPSSSAVATISASAFSMGTPRKARQVRISACRAPAVSSGPLLLEGASTGSGLAVSVR